MNCRSCGYPTTPVLSLGKMPLANKLLRSPSDPYKTYPLDLEFCGACKLGQLRDVVRPQDLFDDYVYYASASPPNLKEAAARAQTMIMDYDLNNPAKDILVAEVGSNDGYLLQFYDAHEVSVLGIDPARGPANAAALKGIPTVQDYFTLALAKTLPKADVIHAHNVLAHVPDMNDFVAGVAEMLKPDGVVVVEVPYIGDMVEKASFDLIYHEHVYYFSVTAAMRLFARHGLGVSRLERIPAQGGSLRLFLSRDAALAEPEEEFDFGEMLSRVESQAEALLYFLLGARRQGKAVWGFGASAKATVMCNLCEIDSSLVPAIADATPAKLGKFIPGTGIPIRPAEEWLAAAPPYTCIFAWNYAQEICHRYAREYKGIMFTPYILPSLSGVEANDAT